MVLQTPYFDERSLRLYLNRLLISLEVQAINAPPPDNPDAKTGHEVIFNGPVPESEDPLIIVQGSDEDDKDGHILIVWKIPVLLSRPVRMRIHSPSMVFNATAHLKPAAKMEENGREDEYLPSMMPSGVNLLESFNDDPALGNVKPRLSAMRVSRVVPTQVTKELTRPLKNLSYRSSKVFPALNARIRYSRTNIHNTPGDLSMIASLDIEVAHFAGCEVSIESVSMGISGGTVEDLNDIQGLQLPLQLLPRDDTTFVYRLHPDESEPVKTHIRVLSVSITARVNLSPTSRPPITTRWKTAVDFTLPVNPSFAHSTSSFSRPRRPSQLSISSSSFEIPTSATSITNAGPDSLPSLDAMTRHERSASIPDFGVTMTFTCPKTPVAIGRPFTWQVFTVNRSDRARKLALVAIPRRRRAETRLNRPPSTGYGRRDVGVADAVMDENVLHAMQKNATLESAEIVCLSADVKIGPLPPQACHLVELKFMPLVSGIVGLEAVRIVDMGTQEHVEVKDLPDVIVEAEE